jgi:protein-disulfide isomerase
MAAEAAESAGAHGKFWEMHDRLFARSPALRHADLLAEAAELGLDVQRFEEDLASRRFAMRVARDVESAEESGVAGTPTFFVNGQRLYGAYDIAALGAAIDRAVREAAVRSGRL